MGWLARIVFSSHLSLFSSSFSDYFTATFNGYFDAATSGNYTFYMKNDAGAQLYIDNQIVIDNDGCMTGAEVQSSVILSQGTSSSSPLYC